jgi:hypothetical protein
MTPRTESKRERELSLRIASGIPRFPNNKETLSELQRMSISLLLVHHMNWAMRYIPPRPREVIVEDRAKSDPLWNSLRPGIDVLLEKSRNGEDLTPHLSLELKTRGYTPTNSAPSKWEDKDFILNIMGYHHFHIGKSIDPRGFIERTNQLVFAKVDREKFVVVAILSHKAFENSNSSAATNAERRDLWDIFEEHSSREATPGAMQIQSLIALSGHPVHIVRTAAHYASIIREIDPKLDDRSYAEELFSYSPTPLPRSPKFKWEIRFLDLALIEEKSRTLLTIRRGHI